MYVGELLPVVVLHDEIRFAFLHRPGRWEAASVRLPPNRYAHAALRAILTNERPRALHAQAENP